MIIAILLDNCRDRSYWLCDHMIFDEDNRFDIIKAMLPTVQSATLAKLTELQHKFSRARGWLTVQQIRDDAQSEYDSIDWSWWNDTGSACDRANDWIVCLVDTDSYIVDLVAT